MHKRSDEELLMEAVKGILGSGVTRKALDAPNEMEIDDVVLNRHLYERLGTAFVMVGRIGGYRGLPKGITDLED